MGKKGLGRSSPSPSMVEMSSDGGVLNSEPSTGRNTPIRYFENGHPRGAAVPASPEPWDEPEVVQKDGWDLDDEDDNWDEEEGLLTSAVNGSKVRGEDESGWIEGVARELKLQGRLATPLAVMQLLWYCRMVVSLVYLGHISEADLAGAALAITFANVTGYSLLFGLASGMDPLCSQAFGAGEFAKVGSTLQQGWAILLLACVPCLALWLSVEPILNLLGQDRVLAALAGTYLRHLAPDLVITALAQPLRTFLRSQRITLPMALSAFLAFSLHIPLNYLFIYTLNLKAPGAAIASCLTSLNFFLCLLTYIRFSKGPHRKAWLSSWDYTALKPSQWGPLLRLAVPSAVGICQEWWCYEVMTLLAGWLPNPHTAVSAMSLTMTVSSVVYMLPLSLSFATAVRVGNELGAGMPTLACLAAEVSTSIACIIGALACGTLTFFSHPIGGLFTHEKTVINLVSSLLPILGVCELFNCPQAVLVGVLRGSSRPKAGMLVGIVSYYLVGLSSAVVLVFKLGFGAAGFWWGLTIAQATQVLLLGWLVFRSDWIELAMQAKKLTAGAEAERSYSKLYEIGEGVTMLDDELDRT